MAAIVRVFTLGLLGDIMLGRLVDQLFCPVCVTGPLAAEDKAYASHYRELYRREGYTYGPSSPWGTMLEHLHATDWNVGNLETSLTTSARLWPNKTFNFRAHPDRVESLRAARIGHVSCANNHVLDFSEEGLQDTIESLERGGISFAGIGRTRAEARGPRFLEVPFRHDRSAKPMSIAFFSASDHPEDWAQVEGFFFLPVDDDPRPKELAEQIKAAKAQSDLVVFSLHWGPNYQWIPNEHIQNLARWLIDQGVDVIHGHSSHHVQAIEIYKGRPICYGLGDAGDDYIVHERFRNDLSFFQKLLFSVVDEDGSRRVELSHVDLIPLKISRMMMHRIRSKPHTKENGDTFEPSHDAAAYDFLLRTMKDLCRRANDGRDLIGEIPGEDKLRLAVS
ncbi:putative polyglutamate biosynthesis protein [Hyaloraphidium curvatum]|nr:putative polyglutamate biosynthesis protein [Hyaloraphidium curvatum]